MSFQVTLVSMDGMGAAALGQACRELSDPQTVPRFETRLEVIDISEVQRNRDRDRLTRALQEADLLIVSHLHEESHARVLLRIAGEALRPETSVLVFHSSGSVMPLVRVGRFVMGRSSKKKRKSRRGPAPASIRHFFQNPRVQRGLKRFMGLLPRLLALVPGRMRDMRTFVESYLAWLEGSAENIGDLILRIAHRHQGHPELAGTYTAPRRYPDVGAWHPATRKIHPGPAHLIRALDAREPDRRGRPRIAILVLRGQILANDTHHIEALVEALESRGLRALALFGSIFDYRPVLDKLETLWIDGEKYKGRKSMQQMQKLLLGIAAAPGVPAAPLQGGEAAAVIEKWKPPVWEATYVSGTTPGYLDAWLEASSGLGSRSETWVYLSRSTDADSEWEIDELQTGKKEDFEGKNWKSLEPYKIE